MFPYVISLFRCFNLTYTDIQTPSQVELDGLESLFNLTNYETMIYINIPADHSKMHLAPDFLLKADNTVPLIEYRPEVWGRVIKVKGVPSF